MKKENKEILENVLIFIGLMLVCAAIAFGA